MGKHYQLHSWLSRFCGLERLKDYKTRVHLGVFAGYVKELTATKLMRNDHYQNPPSGDGAWS
jgi:hypothetical protein